MQQEPFFGRGNVLHVHVARALVNHGAVLDDDCMETNLVKTNALNRNVDMSNLLTACTVGTKVFA